MIPEPISYKSHSYPLFRLRATYHWSEDQFKALRKAVHSAHNQYLDDGRTLGMQNKKKWKKFKHQIIAEFPELEEFEDHWPIYVVLKAQRKNERQRERKQNKKSKIACHHGGHISSVFIGKPLPQRMRFQIGRITTPAGRPLAEFHKKVVTPISIRPSSEPSVAQPGPSHRPTQGPQLRTGRNSEQMTRRPETSALIGREPLNVNTGCAVCLFCNHTPDVPAGAKSHIQLFSQNKAIIDALAGLGIINDKHLSILNLLMTWNAGPEEFLGSLAEGTLCPLYKLSLLQHFQKFYLSRVPASPYQFINCWSGCSEHLQGNNSDNAPPKLQKLLEMLSMEELMPVFSAAHVKTDDDFDLLHDLDKSQRLAVFDGDQFRHIRPFQRWMLNFLLAHINILD